MQRLTAFADYKLPQVLRELGIISYDRRLASRIDAMESLRAGCEEEVEIRAMTVWAAEQLEEGFPGAWTQAYESRRSITGSGGWASSMPFANTHTTAAALFFTEGGQFPHLFRNPRFLRAICGTELQNRVPGPANGSVLKKPSHALYALVFDGNRHEPMRWICRGVKILL